MEEKDVLRKKRKGIKTKTNHVKNPRNKFRGVFWVLEHAPDLHLLALELKYGVCVKCKSGHIKMEIQVLDSLKSKVAFFAIVFLFGAVIVLAGTDVYFGR